MSQQVTSGRIEVHDIEELNYCVSPWQLDMRQISGWKFHALLDFVQINGMLLSRERWSQRVRASGVSPRDYLALAGPCIIEAFSGEVRKSTRSESLVVTASIPTL